MKLLLIVLNKTEKLDELLEELIERGIKGATIFNSIGMARELGKTLKTILYSARFAICMIVTVQKARPLWLLRMNRSKL